MEEFGFGHKSHPWPKYPKKLDFFSEKYSFNVKTFSIRFSYNNDNYKCKREWLWFPTHPFSNFELVFQLLPCLNNVIKEYQLCSCTRLLATQHKLFVPLYLHVKFLVLLPLKNIFLPLFFFMKSALSHSSFVSIEIGKHMSGQTPFPLLSPFALSQWTSAFSEEKKSVLNISL